MDQIEIKQINLSQLEQLQQIGRQTFFETFSEVNTEDNMNKYMEDSFNLERLALELENVNSEFYFAIIHDKVVGYLKVNSGQAQTEKMNEKSLELERIYVLKAFQGQRIGQVLFNKALEIARHKTVHFLWLGVWEHNHKARRFYGRNGFAEFGNHIFTLGTDVQTDIMMKLPIA